MYHDRTAWRCAFFVGKNLDAAKDIHKEMLPIWEAFFLWISFAASIFFTHKKRTMHRCSIVAHVFRGAAIL
jgi:hypothetical protein